MVFFKLSKIFLPSSTPSTIEAKSSFSKIMSAASLVTSDPVIPIEIPISPCLMAGESLTPSPVTPQMNPTLWQALTIFSSCFGEREKKKIFFFSFFISKVKEKFFLFYFLFYFEQELFLQKHNSPF